MKIAKKSMQHFACGTMHPFLNAVPVPKHLAGLLHTISAVSSPLLRRQAVRRCLQLLVQP